MKCKILQPLFTTLYNFTTLFILKKSVYTSPWLSLYPTSLSQTPSPSAILRQQQVENLIFSTCCKYNNHNNILYTNIFIEVH